ncbi:NAD(P)H quinone oxidoreductase, PIG3 family [Gemmatirosa kalamazoonensis]|uniref:NAD(P)H quinone oxidoreductase, PIG3 family n=1 Tax=Gemmatirosa kalamazoonensis TaxID=861299 RepID=W0REL1_9BACT|nr:NAD(P)H-quinone oxidoreductase [Gemmatirosa kalamazoonensis]AHG89549.1 NAD(P)H quinone oxidoreductase, PIG3 family [Gemmatirosa kalamazoonensis]
MKAAVITKPGGPDVLEIHDRPDPVPGHEQILVRVRASALNRADLLQRRGAYPPPAGAPVDIPGIEFAGEVVALGPGAREWRVGDRVWGLVGGGAHAELLVTHERAVAPIPDALAWADAGAVPEAFITAHDALRQADARPGEVVLVHAVGSGVGLAAAQLSRAWGMRCLGTARTPQKLDRARNHGLDAGLALGTDLATLAPFVREHTDGRGADVALDLVGGPYLDATLGSMATLGRIVLVGTMAGARGELDYRRLLQGRITLRGTVLRARPIEERIAVTRRFGAEVGPALASGAVRPVVDSRFSLDELPRAHERLESNATFGKVVVTMS